MKSIEHQFLDFCRSKPAEEAYDYTDNQGCALCQFLTAAGYPVRWVGGWGWTDESGQDHPLPEIFLPCGSAAVLQRGHRTFGALTERLETALLAKQSA